MKEKVFKYIEVYDYYKNLIEKGVLKPGAKLPSLLATAKELSVSKTTVENAYFQLATDGYVISKEKSGYYVANRDFDAYKNFVAENKKTQVDLKVVKYDLSVIGDDPTIFKFDLWKRYLKSALRHEERLVTYGEPQGELELREAICGYLKKHRNIYCSPDSILIGASTQSLLMLLLPILKQIGASTASVPAAGFERYAEIFKTHEFNVGIRNKESDVIYVSPSHMTAWGDVMPISRRYEILEHSRNNHLIIEDDYLNELVFSKQYCPSIYALSGGENVIYIGSFSRLLLPSIRISYMVLPEKIINEYKSVYSVYDQTASKTEQLALAGYLRDDNISKQIKRKRKLYNIKNKLLKEVLVKLTNNISGLSVYYGECGTEMVVSGAENAIYQFKNKIEAYSICGKELPVSDAGNKRQILFSCGIISVSELELLLQVLVD